MVKIKTDIYLETGRHIKWRVGDYCKIYTTLNKDIIGRIIQIDTINNKVMTKPDDNYVKTIDINDIKDIGTV